MGSLSAVPTRDGEREDRSGHGSQRPRRAWTRMARVTASAVVADVIDVAAGTWAVFRVEGPYPAALQSTWAATAAEWFPSQPWRLREGPSIVAVLDRSPDFRTATCELWLPVERAEPSTP